MDMIVLCRCGHPSALHGDRGCGAGRYQPCGCLLTAQGAVQAAINNVRSGPPPREPKRVELHK
jgi:hypothetical protein